MSSMITDDAKKEEICKIPKTKDILINVHDTDLEFIGTLTARPRHPNVSAELLETSRESFHKEAITVLQQKHLELSDAHFGVLDYKSSNCCSQELCHC